jgi:signal transduction histidine kinase
MADEAAGSDRTGSRHAQADLAAYIDQLERANSELADANQFKADLITMFAHEIGQPLTTITTFSELVCGSWDELSEQQRLDDIRKVHTSARRWFGVVGDLLHLIRLDARGAAPGREPVGVAALLGAVAGSFGGTATVVAPEAGLTVLGDPGQLRQILANLLSNAARYGRPPIEVEAQRAAGRAEIRVRDHGDGLPEELIPRLFDRTGRLATGAASTVSRLREGGPGLFVARRLAEANGGTLRYEQAPVTGSCFVLELDLAGEGLPSPGRVSQHAASGGNPFASPGGSG